MFSFLFDNSDTAPSKYHVLLALQFFFLFLFLELIWVREKQNGNSTNC